MKRFIVSILAALLFAVSFNASATIAYPYPITVIQPDGSTITIQLHGDEFHHWITSDGKVVEKAPDGFYRRASLDKATYADASFEKARRNAPQKASSSLTTGENHFLVVLVAFKDLSFSISEPQQAFYNLLNQEKYGQNGGTGSVKDFYFQNSNGVFDPVYDVIGPVTLSNKYSYYGSGKNGNDTHAALAFWEACQQINPQVDFSKYDLDGDGVIDNIFFYYAGHNEAEGASSDHIWPHQWDFYSASRSDSGITSLKLDGKTLGTYACTSELRGYTGAKMCGIGTFCHEFGHVLGLPDFYDTDYEENGECYGMGEFSLMGSGNYNNGGCTPPALTAVEREMLGWMKEIPEWTTSGAKTVPDIIDNVAFKSGTNTDQEYFVYETRGGSVWDSYLGSKGLLIYHVDRSTNRISGKTAASLWTSGKINAYADHPCCQPMPASGSFTNGQITYPGSRNITSFNENSPSPMVDWNGNQTGRSVTDIKYASGEVTLNFGLASGKTVSGTVKDKDGKPVIGATVVLSPASPTKMISKDNSLGLDMNMIRFSKAKSSSDYTATISSDGSFSFDLAEDPDVDFTLTVSCYGYMDYVNSFRLTVGAIERDIVLKKVEILSDETEYQKFDWAADLAIGVGQAAVASIKYTSDELADAVGAQITSVGFVPNEAEYNELRVIIDFGDETVLDLPVGEFESGYYNEVDISSYGIVIPEDTDIYVGYYADVSSDYYPFIINTELTDRNGLFIRVLEGHYWNDFSSNGTLAVGFVVKPLHSQPFLYGYNGIANPKDGKYVVGESFKFELVKSAMVPDSVDWFYDGESVTGSEIEVTAGEHVVKAVLHFNSGRTETIEQLIFAE